MAKANKSTETTTPEVLEHPEVILSKAEDFFSNKKNRLISLIGGGLIALLIAGFFGYSWYIDNLNQEAQKEMFQAVFYFESDSLGLALNGDGNSYGFLEIIEKYKGTKASNLSSFYAGAIYLKLNDFDNAIRLLKNFSSSDVLVQARAYSLIGDAYMESDDFKQAETYFSKAVNHQENAEFTPVYLNKLAISYEKQNKFESALSCYETITTKYLKSSLLQEAQKQKARLEGLITQ